MRGKVRLERKDKVPKIKTKKAAAKRFKITGTGKMMHRGSGKGHLMLRKSASRRRRLTLGDSVSGSERAKVRRLIPHA